MLIGCVPNYLVIQEIDLTNWLYFDQIGSVLQRLFYAQALQSLQ